MPFCKQCGNSLREGASFCRGCGAKVAVVSPAAIPTPPEPQPTKVAPPSRPEPALQPTHPPFSAVKLIAVTCILLLLVAAVGFAVQNRQKKAVPEEAVQTGGQPPEEKSLHTPSLVGLTESQAREQIADVDKSLRLVVTERAHNDTIPNGQIVSQKSPPDSIVSPGFALEVTVSKGPMEGGSSQSPTATEDEDRAHIQATIMQWKAAWAALDFSTFISHYSRSAQIFTNGKWIGYDEFRQAKQRKFASGGHVQLELGTPSIHVSHGVGTASFQSRFHSTGGYSSAKNFSVVSRQTLKLEKDGSGSWVIVRDESH
ncbi:MAG: hypothetical protein JWN14_2540 [Chthonomonadales bacterium]|nr:hypothetical protein [Chthonomonadales bacterium]